MNQYMIIRGMISFKGRESDPVAVTSKNGTLELTGSSNAVQYWSKMLSESLTLAQSFKQGELLLNSYASANSMVDIFVFDNLNYDEHKEEFEAIKGLRRKIKITRVPSPGDPDFSKEKVKQFILKNQMKRDG
jgi:hypothetical protein